MIVSLVLFRRLTYSEFGPLPVLGISYHDDHKTPHWKPIQSPIDSPFQESLVWCLAFPVFSLSFVSRCSLLMLSSMLTDLNRGQLLLNKVEWTAVFFTRMVISKDSLRPSSAAVMIFSWHSAGTFILLWFHSGATFLLLWCGSKSKHWAICWCWRGCRRQTDSMSIKSRAPFP